MSMSGTICARRMGPFLRPKNSGTSVSKMLGPVCLHEVWDHLCPNVRGLCLPLRMNGTICAPLLFFAPWELRSFCIQMVGLCATMKYGTICARYIEALLWRKWVAICVAETYFLGSFSSPFMSFLHCYYLFVYVMFFFVILLICLSVLF